MTQKQFVNRWLEEMDRARRHDRTSYWEGEEAVKELGKKYPRLLTAHSLRREAFINDLVREARLYELLRTQVAESNRAFETAFKVLGTIKKNAQGQATSMERKSGPAFRRILNSFVQLETEIERCFNELRTWRSAFWRRTLTTYPGKKGDAKDIWIPVTAPEDWGLPQEEVYTGAVKEAIERGSRLPDPKPEPKRAIDLDSRFQIRVASLFGLEFPRLKKSTRARLVVLVYICFNFVTVDNSKGELKIRPSEEQLTVSAVSEKLKRYERRRASTTA